MKKEKKIGAYFGIAGGVIGLWLFAFFFELKPSVFLDHTMKTISLIVPTIFFSAWFGRRAGIKIHVKNENAFLEFLWSGLFTVVCSIVTFIILISVFYQKSDYLMMIPIALSFSFIIGSIPVIVLSLLFGYLFRVLLKRKQ